MQGSAISRCVIAAGRQIQVSKKFRNSSPSLPASMGAGLGSAEFLLLHELILITPPAKNEPIFPDISNQSLWTNPPWTHLCHLSTCESIAMAMK